MTLHKICGVLLSVVLASGVLGAAPIARVGQTDNPGLALRGATVYPAPDRPAIRDGVVIIRNGRIQAVGARSRIALPSRMPILDLAGLSLAAGFWNRHVHFSGSQWAEADTHHRQASPGRSGRCSRDGDSRPSSIRAPR